jgi:hypothetical protein
VEESSSNCWEFQCWHLRCVQKKFFKLLKALSFKCVKEFFANVTSFKSNFKFMQENFSSVWGFYVKVLFCDITIEWEDFKCSLQTLASFFNLKFSHSHFIWIKKHRVFVLTFVFKKMSSFQMESLKVMEKFDGGNFHFWEFKMRMMLSKHGL